MKKLSKVTEFIKRHLIIISTVAAVLLISVGVVYSSFDNPPPAESPPPVTPPAEQPAPPTESKPPPAPAPAPPPPTFEQKIKNFTESIFDVCDTGESKEITLVFTEIEVNEQTAKLLAHIDIPADIPLEIEAVDIDFQAANKVLTESKSIIYDKFHVTIKAQVSVEEGEPEVEVTSISFGFIPLPKPLRDRIVALGMEKVDAVQAQLTQAGAGCNGKVDLEFTNINIQESNITISVLIKPRA
ncbi:hypothetical protein ACFLVS_00060 [Chloroflexota bacterium]